jgi:uncharacterized protein DUF6221
VTDVYELITWLRAQLDHDEQVAVEARDTDHSGVFDGTGIVVMHAATGTRNVTLISTVATHIADWDPARVLAEVDAKRRMLDWLTRVDEYMDRDDMSWHRLGGAIDTDDAVRLLAQPYAGREGWRTEWTTTD